VLAQDLKGWKPGYSSKFRPILAVQEPLTIFHGIKQKKKFFFEKKNPKWPTQKNLILPNGLFSIFFCQIEQDGSLG
jgi:hypothetical protein